MLYGVLSYVFTNNELIAVA